MSKPIDQELLPCPFCGDPSPNLTHDDYVHEDGRPMAVVECTKCHTWVRAEAWNKRTAVQPAGGAVPEGWRDAIHNTLRNYRMSTLDDGEGGGYPLIDAMTADGQTVAGGIEECDYLADAIVDALAAAPHPVIGEQKPLAYISHGQHGTGEVGLLWDYMPAPAGHTRQINLYREPPAAQDVSGLLEALYNIGGLSFALRQGGPDPMDLQGLSNALEQAVDWAHEAIAAHRAQQGAQP